MFGKKPKCYPRPFCQLKNCNRLAAMLTTMIEDGQSVMCDNKRLYKVLSTKREMQHISENRALDYIQGTIECWIIELCLNSIIYLLPSNP